MENMEKSMYEHCVGKTCIVRVAFASGKVTDGSSIPLVYVGKVRNAYPDGIELDCTLEYNDINTIVDRAPIALDFNLGVYNAYRKKLNNKFLINKNFIVSVEELD